MIDRDVFCSPNKKETIKFMLSEVSANFAECKEWHQYNKHKHNEPDNKNLDCRFACEMGHAARETATVPKANGDFL